ncbi:GyrI-like domain-containing protein [Cytobacillus sp. IB215665]|uniref:AraC family transcriptional regulator n=1 Tax=Cytobacillus sp. IB215665 TaxID=3097357 RepID=UPI002A10BADE|nr:GyrI-like domain-containing protein [Cytobacillus sp. IB215665]MDX8363926.1 GyrI-like domain-containing protein [Cytobacillus sp. IB215665]
MEKPMITVENYEVEVIYIRFKGTYTEFRKNSRKMFNELFKFAKKYDLIKGNFTKVMTIYHDNPFVTDPNNLRTSVAMTVPSNTTIVEEGKIGTMKFGGKYAVLHYELSLGEYEQAWKYAYSDWLLKNDKYTPRDSVPFELYVTEPPKDFTKKSKTDIYIPIE